MVRTDNIKTAEIKQLAENRQNAVVKRLRILLADEVVLYTRLRNYHWNITSANFYSLHITLENQLDGIAAAMDEVSKCIHRYESYVQITIDEFVRKAHQDEGLGVFPDARTMVANLAADHETIIRRLHEDIKNSGDVDIAAVLTTLLHQHQKMAWMLHKFLED